MAMIEDTNLRNYRPLFVINDAGVMKYADAPLVASLPEARPAPAFAVNIQPAVIAASDRQPLRRGKKHAAALLSPSLLSGYG